MTNILHLDQYLPPSGIALNYNKPSILNIKQSVEIFNFVEVYHDRNLNEQTFTVIQTIINIFFNSIPRK